MCVRDEGASTFEGREFLNVSVLADVEPGGPSVLVFTNVGPCELQLVQHVCVAGRGWWHCSMGRSLKREREESGIITQQYSQ